ncbi:unnamed protein product [Coccothraustes coccothraustes]
MQRLIGGKDGPRWRLLAAERDEASCPAPLAQHLSVLIQSPSLVLCSSWKRSRAVSHISVYQTAFVVSSLRSLSFGSTNTCITDVQADVVVVVNFEVTRRPEGVAFKNTKDAGEVSKGIGMVQDHLLATWN